MKKAISNGLSLIVILVITYIVKDYVDSPVHNEVLRETKLKTAIKLKQSGKMIMINAEVIKILPDDLKGDRHQKMILKTGENTLLLAHNIDLAPRVPVQRGESIQIYGQYEWNSQGGLVHWTHRSNSNHPHGWIKYKNKTYQ